MTAFDFNSWLAAMSAAGHIRTGYGGNADAAELLGNTERVISKYKRDGVPPRDAKVIALACAALLMGIKPFPGK